MADEDASPGVSVHKTDDGSAGHLAIVVEGSVSPEVNKQIMQTAQQVAMYGMDAKNTSSMKAIAKKGSAGSVAIVYREGTQLHDKKKVPSTATATVGGLAPVSEPGNVGKIYPTQTRTSPFVSDAPATDISTGQRNKTSSSVTSTSKRQTEIAEDVPSIPQSSSSESHGHRESFLSSYGGRRADHTASSHRDVSVEDYRHNYDSGSVHRASNRMPPMVNSNTVPVAGKNLTLHYLLLSMQSPSVLVFLSCTHLPGTCIHLC
jgi:hypothetical protein